MTVPLTLLTLANFVVALQSQGPRHVWWLAAVAITLVERIGTFSFFIPTAIKLMCAETRSALANTQARLLSVVLSVSRFGSSWSLVRYPKP
jgi:hypothetical protein